MSGTKIGSWGDFDKNDKSIRASVRRQLGAQYGHRDYDVPGLVDAYRAAINDALPQGIELRQAGGFYGPPRMSDEQRVEAHMFINKALGEIDLSPIAARFQLRH